MAPLTRSRAGETHIPNALMAEYYAQRASAGLIITEGVFPSAMGKGYVHTPGIETEAQVAAWKLVTEAVHARHGRIVLQLWHVGRVSHNELQPDGQAPVAPSAIAAKTKTLLLRLKPLTEHLAGKLMDAGEMSLKEALYEIRSFEAACYTFNNKVGLSHAG